jgi:hypothetical protein
VCMYLKYFVLCCYILNFWRYVIFKILLLFTKLVYNQGLIPSKSRDFLIFVIASRPVQGPTHPPIQHVVGALSPGVKQLGHEADHSPPYSAKFKNVWSYTSTPTYISMAWFVNKQRMSLWHGIWAPFPLPYQASMAEYHTLWPSFRGYLR